MDNEKIIDNTEETTEETTEEVQEEATETVKLEDNEASKDKLTRPEEDEVMKQGHHNHDASEADPLQDEEWSTAKEPVEETTDGTQEEIVVENTENTENTDDTEPYRSDDTQEEMLDETEGESLYTGGSQEEKDEFDIDLLGEVKERVSPVMPVPAVSPQTQKREPGKTSKGISGGKLFTMLVAAALVGSLLSFSIFYAALPSLLQARGLAGTGNNGQSIVINPSNDLNVYSAVAEKAMPSVVGITTVQLTEGLFSGTQRSQGIGTGVIVDDRGYILTNSHVINDGQADEVTVLLHDGSHHTAQVLWHEQAMDLAVIKIDGGVNLIPAELGDSDALIVGEIVVAIGNPLGLNFERTLTQGVVSGLNRSIQVSATQIIDNLIQTDASINPGNSGGPLLNTQGQVIGINTAKMSSGEGLGFSIPINTAKPIVDQFIERGEFRRVYLGIRGFNARNAESATGIPLDVEKGVYVVEVVPGSAADNASLQPEDIVTALNGVEVDTMGSLIRELYKFRPGDQTTVTYLRGEEEFTVDITLTE